MDGHKEKINIKKENENNLKLDQFFTKPKEARRLYNIVETKIDLKKYDVVLEPSVGANSFGCCFPKKKAYLMDIDPKDNVFWHNPETNQTEKINRTKKPDDTEKSEDTEKTNKTKKKNKHNIKITKIDFLSFGAAVQALGLFTNKKVIAIGNPPFGQNSSLAVKFFNICAGFCDTICFIIPRTFKRISVQNQLDLNFHLEYNEDLPYSVSEGIFEPHMGAKCCFQIWTRKDEKREKIKLPKIHRDWEFLAMGPKENQQQLKKRLNSSGALEGLTEKQIEKLVDETKPQPRPPKGASFAMKAYGSNCGEIVTKGLRKLRPKSWHWIKCENPKEMIKKFNSLDYSLSKDTVRQDSLGRSELVKLYTDKYGG
jgi:predicted RNA methylase